MAGRTFSAFVNPLHWLEADAPWSELPGARAPSLESFAAFMCSPGAACDLSSLVQRYREIAVEPVRLMVAPAEERILEKLVWPLRHAKASYVVGNWLGTISLCGMVAEMVAILRWDIADVQVNGRQMTEKDQESIFGRTFHRLEQKRRVEVLAAYGFIDPPLKAHFDHVRTIRNRYLHRWSQEHASKDAVSAFLAAVSLVVATIIHDVRDGQIVLNPRLEKYLESSGVLVDDP